MDITEVFYPQVRAEWRAWLQTYHQEKTEVWLQTFNKASGKPSISYDDLVEECLCFGWIAEIKGASRQEEAQRRLNHLLKMTKQGKMYGTVP